jgi:hypothetical protein
VFPVKPGVDIPAEGFLHLPQKQKFKASVFLEGKVVVIEKAAVALDGEASGRISLLDESRVRESEPFGDWDRFTAWDPASAVERLRSYKPSPLDLEVELQEEVVLHDWQVGKGERQEQDHQFVYPIRFGEVELHGVVADGKDAAPVRKYLDRAKKLKDRPPLFGLMHYDMCRLVFQPLSVLGEKGPEHITISDDKVDRKALLQALKF